MIYLFAAWTVLIWGTRIDNIVSDGGSAAALALAGGMAALGVAVGVSEVLGRGRRVLLVAAAATALLWAVRLPGLLLDGDHGAAFKLVHVGLAAVSVVLAAAVLSRRRAAARRAAVPAARRAPG